MFQTRWIAVFVVVAAIVAGVLYWWFAPKFGRKAEQAGPVNLKVYGLWEEEALIRPALEAYKKLHPDTNIEYIYHSSVNYRTKLQFQIDNNQGPDIFMIHNSWLPMFLTGNYLSPMPESVMGFDEYSKAFYPIVRDSFSKDKKVYAMPRGIDGLALFVNTRMMEAADVQVPKSWDDFVAAATKLTVLDTAGRIQTAGAAIGSTNNVDHWPDILGLLFLQQFSLRSGTAIEKPNTREGAEVLKFYTDFVRDPAKKVWDTSLESSTQAFASERTAFYFAPSWRAHELRVLNPELKFRTVPVPHLNGTKVNWATFWGYAVSLRSQNSNAAWEFVKFLTSSDTQKLLYQEASKVRLFGLPYSRVELQKDIASEPIAGSFVLQAPTYKSWFLSSQTFDKGINDEMIKYFEDAVNAVVMQGASVESALQTVEPGVGQVIEKYIKTTVSK